MSLAGGGVAPAPGSEAAELPPDVTWMMYYAPRPRLLYMIQPKVACSTIKLTLQNAELGVLQEGDPGELAERLHAPNPTVLQAAEDPEDLQRYVDAARLRFCFVRNPYARVLSAYLDKMVPDHLRLIFGEKLGLAAEQLAEPMTFAAFLEHVARQAAADMDVHWRPQTYLYDRLAPVVGFDFIGSFETFDEDFRTVLVAADPDLVDYYAVFDVHATRAADRVAEYYADAGVRRLAEAIYADDFERFGYVMEPEQVEEAPRLARWRTDHSENGRRV